MGFFSDALSPSSILSGGITSINDNLLKAAGTKKDNTFFALNDAMKHGPLETSFDQGRPASFDQLERDRANRLGADKTGTARGIGDIAALVGLAYGGAALAGGSGAGGAAGSSGGGAATGSSGSMWPQIIKGGMQMMGGKGGGMGGGLFGMGQQQQQKPQFDTNAWLQKQRDEQNRMLLAQNLKAQNPNFPPEYNDYV